MDGTPVATAGQVREGDVEDLSRTHGFEDAVEALGDGGAEARVEVRFREDVVRARVHQLGGFVLLARRGDEGAWVVGGEEGGPEAQAAGAAVRQEGRSPVRRRGVEEGAPCRPHAREDAAEDVPGQGGGRDGEAAPRVAEGVLGVGAVVGFAAAVDPARDGVAGVEGGGGAGGFDGADGFFA